jgi:hypothetical protein
LFHPGNALGVSPFKGFLLPRSCASFFRSTLPSWRFFPFLSGSHGSTGDGRPRPAHLEFAAGPFFRLQGLFPPGIHASRQSLLRFAVRRSLHGLFPLQGIPLTRSLDRFRRPILSRDSPSRTPKGFPFGPQVVSPQSLELRARWPFLSRGHLALLGFPAIDLLLDSVVPSTLAYRFTSSDK